MANDVTIYTTGDKAHGLGHVVRMRLLARLLVGRGLSVAFVSQPYTPGWDILKATGLLRGDFSYQGQGAVAIIDVEHGPDQKMIDGIKPFCEELVIVAGNGYTVQDYPLVVRESDLEIYQGLDHMPGDKAISGIEYIIIDPAYRLCRPSQGGHIVVCFGGTDPHELTPLALAALDGIDREVQAPSGEPSLVSYLNGAALMVGAFGTVAWEALAAGVPCVLTGWSENHIKTADRLEHMGLAVSLGLWSAFDAAKMRRSVEMVLGGTHWPNASAKGRALVDGRGAGRVADAICQLIPGLVLS